MFRSLLRQWTNSSIYALCSSGQESSSWENLIGLPWIITTPCPPPHTHTNTLWLNRLYLVRKKSFHKGETGMLFLKGRNKSAPQITTVYFKQQTPGSPRQQKTNPQAYLRTKPCSWVGFRASLRLNIFLVSWLFIWEYCCWQCHLSVGKWL